MSRARTCLSVLALAAAAILATGCGGAAANPSAPAASTSSPSASAAPSASSVPADGAAIAILGFAFDPPELTVAPGSRVVWTNDEDSLHTVTSGLPGAPDGRFDSGEIDTGATFPVTFEEAGTYPFFCARHDFMTGRIIVVP